MLESPDAYRNLVERASDGIAIILDAKFAFVNRRLAEILGRSEGELIEKRFADYVAAREVDRVGEYYRTRLRGGEAPQIYETVLVDAAGREVSVEINACVIPFRGASASMALVRDVTERKRVARALRESEERFRQLAELLPLTVFEIDMGGMFVYANRQGFETFGVSPDQPLSGIAVQDVLDPREHERVTKNVRRIVEGLPVDDHEYLARRRDGTTFPVHIFSSPIIRDGKPAGLRGVVVDISEMRKAQDRVREAEAQYRQAQKMEAIGLLAGGIAHDFNNVIATIRMQAYLALKKLDEDHPARVLVRQIEQATERAGDLTGKLLSFGRKRITRPRPSDVSATVGDMCEMLRRLIGERIELVASLDPDLGLARVDPGQVEQVVVNLVLNARDAMPGGGTLTVETRAVVLGGQTALARTLVVPGEYVRLTVIDNGTGMDEEVLLRAFEPYYTTKGVGKGSGLGLPIVYGIVSQSGGYVWIDSAPGRGTRVDAHFPRVSSEHDEPRRVVRRAESPGRGETVIVVEDEEGLRRAARDALSAAGYETLEAFDGVDAMRVLSGHGSTVHLLLTDVVMPRMGGGELARRARELFPRIKVLYVSGYTADAFDGDRDPLPSEAFVDKPFSPDALLARVRELLDQHTEE